MNEHDSDVGSLSEEAERLFAAAKGWAGFTLTDEALSHLRDAFSSLAKAAAAVMDTRTPNDDDD